MFQSTRPVRGATPRDRRTGRIAQVSIHAPRAGRDKQKRLSCAQVKTFQSTRPVRGATQAEAVAATEKGFQSTRPVRGATVNLGVADCRDAVSIHAPRAGRDRGRGRAEEITYVSIHAPRAGRDRSRHTSGGSEGWFQSTRPVRGATLPRLAVTLRGYGFNPRAPCGARLRKEDLCSSTSCFNPRAPCGARRRLAGRVREHEEFQSTRPVRGATCRSTARAAWTCFNPRAPCGARHRRG